MPGIHIRIEGPTTRLIVMPGTGSDADHLQRSFGPAADRLGLRLVTLEPADDLVPAHLAALDALAPDDGDVIVGGVSIGAAIALDWALQPDRVRRPRCVGVWAALPAWSGAPDKAPAAWSALTTATALERDGLDATVDAMVASSPVWLGTELARSWRALYPGLTGQLRCAAAYHAPGIDRVATLRVPLAVVGAIDDPVHPITVARAWAGAAPRSGLAEVTLDDWGHHPEVLGDRCADIWTDLSPTPSSASTQLT